MNQMKKIIRNLCVGSMAMFSGMILSFSGNAATIVGSLDTLAGFALSDLELTDGTASDHWAIYGRMGTPTGGIGDEFTSKTASSPFGSISGADVGLNLGGRIKFAHGGGFGDFPGATASSDAQGAADQGNAGLISVSFDYTMQGVGEDLSIYLYGLNSLTPTVSLSATMGSSGGSYTNTNVALPTTSTNNIHLGLLQFSVADATIGETMSFTISADYSATIGSQTWWGVGIAGASSTVTAVPEPSTFALLALAAGTLALIRRRRV
jgi:hypothetical protein